MHQREHFNSRLAIVLALAGSAIGLGNIWRFPYVVGEYGGAAFIIVYIAFSLCISLPIMLSESIIGRHARKGVYCALRDLAPRRPWWKWAGLVAVLGAFIISSYYSVVGGWSVDYMMRALMKGFSPDAPDNVMGIFGRMSSSVWEPIAAHTIFLGLCAAIVMLGVKNGIERFNKFSIPLLFILIVGMLVFSVNLPGARGGVEYLLKPDFSKMTAKGLSCALGQSFFSMSLGIGAVLTYASYMKPDQGILSAGVWTTLFDAGFAIMAGFVVMPAVFSAGIAPGAGPSLVFESIPYIFAKMGAASPLLARVASVTFFLTILIAAVTSEISMLEVCVSQLVEQRQISRRKASILVFILAWGLGVLCSLSFGVLGHVRILGSGIFEFFDQLSSNYIMLLGALAFAIFVGWQMKKADVEAELTNGGSLRASSRLFKFLYPVIRYVIPPAIVLIFITNLL
ncbi:MAG: sodium-dependent transporter [Bacteroidales bacterium]|nr:sodium-dependent transporter [Bacteroidales bacterium]